MPITVLEDTINKGDTISTGLGALYSVVSIALVFAILLVIIGITTLVFKLLGLFDMKAEIDAAKKENAPVIAPNNEQKEVVVSDDDMMAAVLVATIDYRKECKGDVRVVSIRELK